MYARTTTFRGRPEAVDAGVAMVRDEVMPALEELGCVGMSVLVDRSTGTCIATSAWETEQAQQASADRIGPLRERAAEDFQSGPPEVRHWEIAILHRVQPVTDRGCARVIWMEVEPSRLDEHLERVRTVVIPRLESFRDFCSMSMLVDRRTGLCAAAATYADRSALDESREPASRLRDEMTRQGTVTIREVQEFDVALAQLRVPETV